MTLPPGPLTFSPILKQIIWGGDRLGTRLGKPIGNAGNYAESWELVDRPGDQSLVASGPLKGKTLTYLISAYKSALFGRQANLTAFPLLLKYLDCNRVLSVQVHPDDRYAQQMPTPDLGKTEAWYILEASPESVIYAGLKQGVSRKELKEAVDAGYTGEVLHSFRPTAGQCLFIPAGTVHALGAGLLVAEIQQSSDTTFRLFDWNRTDANGKPRELHVDKALEVTDYQRGPVTPQNPQAGDGGWHQLVSCEKFELRLGKGIGDSAATQALTTGDDDAPIVLMVTEGRIRLNSNRWESVEFATGATIMLPAISGTVQLEMLDPESQVLEIRLP